MHDFDKVVNILNQIDMAFLCEANWNVDVVPDIREAFAAEGSPFVLTQVECGASKGVLIFEGCNWVVKIPFDASFNDYNDYLTYCAHPEDWEDFIESGGTTFSYAPAANSSDYCEAEEDFYLRAEENGLGDVFLETRSIGRHRQGRAIYVQRKADSIGFPPKKADMDADEENSTLELMDSAQNHELRLAMVWKMIEDYGRDKTFQILKFIRKMGISDLHGENVGTLNGKAVVIDYSGYLECDGGCW